jgi:hypothetical protein
MMTLEDCRRLRAAAERINRARARLDELKEAAATDNTIAAARARHAIRKCRESYDEGVAIVHYIATRRPPA